MTIEKDASKLKGMTTKYQYIVWHSSFMQAIFYSKLWNFKLYMDEKLFLKEFFFSTSSCYLRLFTSFLKIFSVSKKKYWYKRNTSYIVLTCRLLKIVFFFFKYLSNYQRSCNFVSHGSCGHILKITKKLQTLYRWKSCFSNSFPS